MAELYAYAITQSRDRVALVAVGTVAAGTQGDQTQLVLGKPVVPRASVTFLGSVQPEVVVGDVQIVEPPDTTPPTTPTNLHTTSVTSTQIGLEWDTAQDPQGPAMQRSTLKPHGPGRV